MCRARSRSFRFSKIIVGNLLTKRDSNNTKGPSKSSPPPLFDGGGFFERTASKNKGGTIERPPPRRPRPFESRVRGVQKRAHIFCPLFWVSFFTQLNKPLKET